LGKEFDFTFKLLLITIPIHDDSGGSRRGTQEASATPLLWVKKIAEGRRAGRASKKKKTTKTRPPLSSRSRSATG